MATQGPNYPSTAVNDTLGSFTDSWVSPTNVGASDGSNAVASSDVTTKYLKATNYGFSIPDGASIDGIVVEMWRQGGAFQSAGHDEKVELVKGGTIGGTNKATATNWGVFSGFTVSYGSSTDLWGRSWTNTDINSSGFGVAIAGTSSDTNGPTDFKVDYLRITVYYTEGAPPGTYWDKAFLTFRSVPIPHNATINTAKIRFTAKSSGTIDNAHDDVKVKIYGHASDDSTPPTTASEANGMTRTTANVTWDSIAHWTTDTTYDSPEIKTIIQEITNRSGWTTGSDITLFVEDYASSATALTAIKRKAYDYGESTTKSAQLILSWS